VDQIYDTKLGAVRVTEECGVSGRSNERQVTKLRDYIDHVLKKEVGKPPFVPDMLFGTGGTFTALGAIMMARQGHAGQPMWGYRVTRAQIRHLVSDLAQMSLEKRCKVPGLSPQRADIIVAGLAIIERILGYLRVNVVQVHTRGVRDGLLLTMISSRHGASALTGPYAAADGADGSTQRVPGMPATNAGGPSETQRGRSRADRVGGAGGQCRLLDQLRRASQAQLSLDPQQRAARL
jgi:exopolyphosphatase/pppGpp-phosphohydrolase